MGMEEKEHWRQGWGCVWETLSFAQDLNHMDPPLFHYKEGWEHDLSNLSLRDYRQLKDAGGEAVLCPSVGLTATVLLSHL